MAGDWAEPRVDDLVDLRVVAKVDDWAVTMAV
jgi:hypothetical protein